MRIFRYLREHEHALEFVRDGHLKIGTTAEYLTIEDPKRRDHMDSASGILVDQVAHYGDERDWHPPAVKRLVEVGKRPSVIVYQNKWVQHSTPAFCLCTSMKLDRRLLRQFGSHVVTITDPKEFGIAIGTALSRAGFDITGQCFARAVEYEDVLVSHRSEKPPPKPSPFRKAKRFAHEHEYRFVWPVKATPKGGLKPIILKSTAVTPFVERAKHVAFR